MGDHQEAEDLLHDLWLKLNGLETGPIADPRSYLFRMTDNLVLDRRRSGQRRARRDEAWTEAQSGAAIDMDDRPSAEQTLLARERLRSVEHALAELPERTATAGSGWIAGLSFVSDIDRIHRQIGDPAAPVMIAGVRP